MNTEWKARFDRSHDETLTLLREFQALGYKFKSATETRFTSCEKPEWDGISETEGIVTIDPSQHDPESIAHELGHGFHECLRRDYPQLWHDDTTEGETIAETIRYFVELRMNRGSGRQWLPKAEHTAILDACDYKLGGPTGFHTMLANRWTTTHLQAVKEAFASAQLTPQFHAVQQQQELQQIRKVQSELGRRVVVVFRKGGRIKEEHRYDSDSDSLQEVMGVMLAIGLAIIETPIGPGLIGKGFVGLLPWEHHLLEKTLVTPEERFTFSCPVRIADVVENPQTGITTIYLESV